MKLKRTNDFLIKENLELKNINNIFWIPETDVEYLTKGYGELFGEKFENFLKTIHQDMLNEGYVAGLKYCKDQYTKNAASSVHMSKEFGNLSVEDVKVLKELYLEDYERMSTDEDFGYANTSIYLGQVFPFYNKQLMGLFTEKIKKELGNGDRDNMPELFNKNPKSFKHFNRYRARNNFSVYKELQLDDINQSNIDYYIEEGEFFYFIEDIVKKYFYLGALIAQQTLKQDWINKGMKLISSNSNKYVIKAWFKSLQKLAYKTEIKTISNLIKDKIDISNKLRYF